MNLFTRIPALFRQKPFRPNRPASLPAVAAGSILTVIAVSVYYWWVWGSLSGFVQAIDFYDKPFGDFGMYYYEMGKQIFISPTPISGFYYSPAFALALSVFGTFSPETATILWGGVQVFALLGFAVLSYRVAARMRLNEFIPFLLLVLTSFPLLHNFAWGQASILLVLAVLGALLMAERGRWVLAALFLSLAVCVKYYPVIFLIPFLIRRNWKLTSSFVGSTALLVVIVPAVVLGWHETISFLATMLEQSREVQVFAGGPNSQHITNVLMRWISPSRDWIEPARLVITVIGLLVVEANVALVFFLRRLETGLFYRWAFVLLFLSLPFFISTSWPHYLVYLPLCQLFLFGEVARWQAQPGRRRNTLMALLAGSVALASVFVFQATGSWKAYNGWGLLFVSNGVMLGVSYMLLLPGLKSEFRRLSMTNPASS